MSAFFDRFNELCKEHGETPNSVAKKLGIPSGSVTAWKKGAEPRSKTVWKLVDFFGVDFNYMMGRTNRSTSINLKNGKIVINRPKNAPALSEEEWDAGEEYEFEEIQNALNARAKKASTDGERIPHRDKRELLAGRGVSILLDADAKLTEDQLDDIINFIQFQQEKNGRFTRRRSLVRVQQSPPKKPRNLNGFGDLFYSCIFILLVTR